MNRKSGSGSGPFLMEMLVAVGFFIICASICVMVFVKADSISRDARDMNQAVQKAQSLAEELKAGVEPEWTVMIPDRSLAVYGLISAADQEDPAQAQWRRELADSEDYEGNYLVYWNGNWEEVEPVSDIPYLGVVSRGTVKGMKGTDILILRYGRNGSKGKVLYRLQTEEYEAP